MPVTRRVAVLPTTRFRLEPPSKPVHDWVRTFERTWNARLGRLDDILAELQNQEESP